MINYNKYMKKCIQLAKKGEGKTAPNPLVGCIVLDKNGKEISTGYHSGYGKPHAEVEALSKINNNEAFGGTLIVNLEPCSHWGKTPPCADLIIEKGIKTLVIGMKDPNPLVAGKGIEKCKNAGITVIENILNDEVEKLNSIFIKNMLENECYVSIKTATTIDGKIATKTGSSKWITSDKARKKVQELRNKYDAIITTSSTIINDNPSMNCRLKNGKNPIKIILDRELKTNYDSKIYQSNGEKIYIVIDKEFKHSKTAMLPTSVALIKCECYNKKIHLPSLFKILYKKGIRSVLVESGGKLNGEIISQNLADKIYHFIAPKILGDKNGINAFYGRNIQKISNTINYKIIDIADFSPDLLLTYIKD